MNALKINNFKFEKRNKNYLYIIKIKGNIYYLKRILNNREIIIIKIFNDLVEFNCIRNNKKANINLLEKDLIINDIINNLKSNILIDFINLNKLSNIIKNTYINIHYSSDILGLSVINNNLINIILIETNSILGNIKIDYDVKINVDEIYLKETLELLSNYLNFKKNKSLVLE